MSNIFNQQLSTALSSVSGVLQQNELSESTTVQSAMLALYHAHGLTSKTENQLLVDQEKNKEAAEQNKVVSIGATSAVNIVTAANAAVLDAGNTTRSASTTAAAVQKAATALTNLAGNVATTLAVAASLDNGSKIQSLVKKANAATRAAAKLAEEASIIALNLTIEASKSNAANVVQQAGAFKANVTTLQKSLADTFSKQQDLVTADLAAVSAAIVAESGQAGVYKTASAESDAIDQSADFINTYLNNDLSIVIAGEGSAQGSEGNQFTLSFTPFKEEEDGTEIVSEYRLMLVKQDDAANFTVDSAKAVINPSPTSQNYVAIKPSGKSLYSNEYFTDEYYSIHGSGATEGEEADASARKPQLVACDINGAPVERGTPYVSFVYVVFTQEFQVSNDDTNGLLSQPGPDFTLETDLPVVAVPDNISLTFFKENGVDAARIAFKVPQAQMIIGTEIDLDELMEFRTFIFSTIDKEAFALNLQIDAAADVLYQREQSYRQAEEVYQLAEAAYNLALAQGASPQEILRLKNEVLIAKSQYQDAKTRYNQQVDAVDALNQRKISDFRFDESIVESLPRAYSLVAKRNDKLPSQLQDAIKSFEKELKANDTQLERTKKSLDDLNGKIIEINKKIADQEAAEKADDSEVQKLKQELKAKIAQFEALYNAMASIKSAQDAQSILERLSGEEKNEQALLKEIIVLFKKITDTESAEVKQAKNLNGLRNQLKGLYAELDLQRARRQALEDEIQQLNANMTAFTACAKAIGEENADFRYYEAVNTSGDFTDNYGDVLLGAQSYCCLALSAIKDSEPDAAPLYASRMSDFSGDVVFP